MTPVYHVIKSADLKPGQRRWYLGDNCTNAFTPDNMHTLDWCELFDDAGPVPEFAIVEVSK